MIGTGKVVLVAGLIMAPVTFAFGTETVQITSCSASDPLLAFTDLTTEGSVDSGAAVIPKGSQVSFSVGGSGRSLPGATRLAAYSIVSGMPVTDYIRVAGGNLTDFADVAQSSFSRTFILAAPLAFPAMSFKARMIIQSADGKNIGCFEFPAKYVSATS